MTPVVAAAATSYRSARKAFCRTGRKIQWTPNTRFRRCRKDCDVATASLSEMRTLTRSKMEVSHMVCTAFCQLCVFFDLTGTTHSWWERHSTPMTNPE
jgi:hypothetical protein